MAISFSYLVIVISAFIIISFFSTAGSVESISNHVDACMTLNATPHISIGTDAQQYSPGQVIEIFGNVTNNTSGKLINEMVKVNILDPIGKSVGGQVTCTIGGKFGYNLTNTQQTGTYKIFASTKNSMMMTTVSVLDLFADIRDLNPATPTFIPFLAGIIALGAGIWLVIVLHWLPLRVVNEFTRSKKDDKGFWSRFQRKPSGRLSAIKVKTLMNSFPEIKDFPKVTLDKTIKEVKEASSGVSYVLLIKENKPWGILYLQDLNSILPAEKDMKEPDYERKLGDVIGDISNEFITKSKWDKDKDMKNYANVNENASLWDAKIEMDNIAERVNKKGEVRCVVTDVNEKPTAIFNYDAIAAIMKSGAGDPGLRISEKIALEKLRQASVARLLANRSAFHYDSPKNETIIPDSDFGYYMTDAEHELAEVKRNLLMHKLGVLCALV